MKQIKLNDININTDSFKKKANEEIAIVGIALNMPTGEEVDRYWETLKNGCDEIKELSKERKKDIFDYFKGIRAKEEIEFQECAYLRDIDKFDNKFFNISPTEAKLMSPIHRLHMEVIWRALEDSGYKDEDVDKKHIGIFAGLINDEDAYYYRNLIKEYDPTLLRMALSGNIYAMIASRISYYLNLKGPAVMVDTACSSSMSALIMAIESLRSGQTSAAVVTGGKINFMPIKDENSMLGIESSDNKTRSFDDKADGSAFGEGVAALVLKPLSKAEKDNDKIYGVIKGYATNQDGKSMGITAPNLDSQCDVIKRSLKSAGISAKDISYFEAHGTATNIGDVIELSGIEQVLGSATNKKAYCAIGSVKSNIGHLYGASGVASIIKCLLAMKNSVIPPSINFNYPTKKVNLIDSPIYINTVAREWKTEEPKKCCVSNFGITGTNCNIVLEEYKKEKNNYNKEKHNVLLCFTAKSKKSFEMLLKKYISFLADKEVNIDDLSYSTLIRRNHFSYRLILITSSIDETIRKLKYVLEHYESGKLDEDCYYNHVEEVIKVPFDDVEKIVKSQNNSMDKLRSICKYYIKGYDIKWDKILLGKADYIDIPSYPFDKKRQWIDMSKKRRGIRLIADPAQDENSIEKEEEVSKKEITIKGKNEEIVTEEEISIGKIWANVLGFEEINIDDNYFEIGGDSILGIRIINLINDEYGLDLSVSNLLGESTVRKLAHFVKDRKDSNYKKVDIIEKVEEKEYYDLSSSQMRIFLLEQIESNLTKYNINAAYMFEGNLDVDKLEKAINEIINRHEVLRSQFVIHDGVPKQKVLDKVEFSIEIKENVEDIDELIKGFVRRFDLEKPPLMRTMIGYLKDNRKVFLFDMHHIVTDGTSYDNLIHEMECLYNGKALEPLKIQYKDYSNYYSKLTLSEKWKRQEEYWVNRFRDNIPVLNLQSTNERKNKVYTKGRKFHFKFDDNLYKKLTEFVASNKVTNFMVTITALYILLYKHSNDKEICIGTPTSGRINSQLNNLIGVFINTLVIKNSIDDNLSFMELLENVKKTVLEAFDNSEYGYESLVGKVRVNKDISRNPLFDVMFIYQNLGDKSINFKDCKFTWYDIKEAVPKYDLTLELLPKENEILGNFEYSSELFSEEYIDNLYIHYINILNEVINKKDIKIKDINILGSEEKEKIISLGKGYVEKVEGTVVDKFLDVVSRFGDKTAVIFRDKTLTYKELNLRANKIAYYLNKEFGNRKIICPVVMSRSIELIATLLGVLKAGGSYIPIDPEYPIERIEYILKDSGSEFILTTSETNFRDENIKKIFIEDILNEETHCENINNSSIDDNSYIIYTSGSTGNPKGVIIRHREMSNFVQGINRIVQFEKETKILSVTTISFDIFVLESFVPLCNGLQVVLADEIQTNDVDKMGQLIKEAKVDVAQFTPSRAQMMLTIEENAKTLSELKVLFVGGEAFPEDLLEQLKKYTNARIINMYGPTETTVWSTFKELTCENYVSIGRPIVNTNIYILNEDNDLQFLGGSGEIAIGGLGVTKGYVNNEKLTNSKFIKSKFNDDYIYKTGDLGKWQMNGDLCCMGRMDNQVKVRGYRVELGEIEEVILKYEKVLRCAVITKDINKTVSIIAFIVISEGFLMEELKKYIQGMLPAYMIPSSINIIDDIPMTANGKINRKELVKYEIAADETENLVKAETETEIAIFNIWVKVLQNGNFGIRNKFFEVGGNSLALIKMMKLIKDIYLTKITSADLFNLQTIENIANYIDNENNNEKVLYESIELPDIFFSHRRNGNIDEEKITIDMKKYNDYDFFIGMYFKLIAMILKTNKFGVNILNSENRYITEKLDMVNLKTIEDLIIYTNQVLNKEAREENLYMNSKDEKNHMKILVSTNREINVDKELKIFQLIIKFNIVKDKLNIKFIYNTKFLNVNAVKFMKENYIKMIKKYGGM